MSNDLAVTLVLDRTGSMERIRDRTISAVNEFKNGLARQPGRTWLTLVLFDTQRGIVPAYVNEPVQHVPDLTRENYVPDGRTNLYDAVADALANASQKHNEEPGACKTLFAVMTDGEENASVRFTADQVKALVALKEQEGWEFLYLGVGIDNFADAQSMGIRARVGSQHSSSVGVQYSALTKAVARYRTGAEDLAHTAAAVQSEVDEAEGRRGPRR